MFKLLLLLLLQFARESFVLCPFRGSHVREFVLSHNNPVSRIIKKLLMHRVFWHQSEARTAATVWNWSGKTLSPGALVAVLYFSSCFIFPPVYSGMLRHGSPSNLHNLAKWHLKRIVLISRHETWQEVLARWP